MTVESCSILCGFDDYVFFGVEAGSECWCADTINPNATPTAVCNAPCAGNPQETCGGTWAINVYQIGSGQGPSPTPANIPGYQYMGCYSDADQRTLNGANTADQMLTEMSCVDFCEDNGYNYFGTEVGTECWCGDGISSPGQMINSGSCNQGCGGDGSELCGGNWAINIWGPTPTPTPSPTPPPATVTCTTLCTGPGDCSCGCSNGAAQVIPCAEWCCLQFVGPDNAEYDWLCGDDLSEVCIND